MMERLNLNVPKATREKLKRLASRADLREAELARELLVRAVEEAERREIRDRFKTSMSPKLRGRLREITRAMEKLRGGAR